MIQIQMTEVFFLFFPFPYLDIKVEQKDWNKCNKNKWKCKRDNEQDGNDLKAVSYRILESFWYLGLEDFNVLTEAIHDATNRR